MPLAWRFASCEVECRNRTGSSEASADSVESARRRTPCPGQRVSLRRQANEDEIPTSPCGTAQNHLTVTIEHVIQKLHLGRLLSILLTVTSIYFWSAVQNLDSLHIIGIVINVAGLFLWWTARLTLGNNWSTGFGKPRVRQLVTHGVYSKIRHPLYWGMIATFIGLILLYPQPLFTAISIVFILYFSYRMKVESDYLLEKLGEEYRNYKNKTWI